MMFINGLAVWGRVLSSNISWQPKFFVFFFFWQMASVLALSVLNILGVQIEVKKEEAKLLICER
jgi:hypothetical protein